MPSLPGDLTISRIVQPHRSADSWKDSDKPLRTVDFRPEGKIEDSPEAIQVDFADPYIGGGVDATGDQEQILFVIYPEVHVSYLVCECMGANEAILVSGFQRFGDYTGYGSKLKCAGYHADPLASKLDGHNRIPRHMLAIDAEPSYGSLELEDKMLMRDLSKAYIGFTGDRSVAPDEKLAISTGKWGCGAFGGSPQVKFVLQWLAASERGRDMLFYSFGDKAYKELEEVMAKWAKRTVGGLFKAVMAFAEKAKTGHDRQLFKYLANFLP